MKLIPLILFIVGLLSWVWWDIRRYLVRQNASSYVHGCNNTFPFLVMMTLIYSVILRSGVLLHLGGVDWVLLTAQAFPGYADLLVALVLSLPLAALTLSMIGCIVFLTYFWASTHTRFRYLISKRSRSQDLQPPR